MSKLRLLGSALRLRASSLPPVRRLPMMRFSTETVGQQQSAPPPSAEGDQQPKNNPSFDPFLQRPSEGLVFGRLTGIGRNTTKTDMIHFLEGCNLSTNDVKVEYTRNYLPVGMMLQFSSPSSFDTAVRHIVRKGRLYKLEKIDRSQWDHTTSYDGKTIMLQGIPRTAFQEDVERFLSGCNYDQSTILYNQRSGFALIKFPSALQAINTFAVKNKGFCLNSPVAMRVLH